MAAVPTVMTKRTLLCVVCIAGLSGHVPAKEAPVDFVEINGQRAHPTRILAKVKPAPEATAHAFSLAKNGLTAIQGFDLVPGLVVLDAAPSVVSSQSSPGAEKSSVSPEQQLAATLLTRIKALRASGLYEYVEPDYVIEPFVVPTDEAYADGRLWSLRNTGQGGGTEGVDIEAERAWDITTGSDDVIVAVIDSGIRYTHRDLADNMWRNPGEIAGNGFDDDGNGYVDDVFGIDAITGSGDPSDNDGHGTHVSGTIGAVANGGGPHVGVAWNVRLMALKFLGPEGTGTTSDALKCVEYAVEHGAAIINASWGGDQYVRSMEDAILYAGEAGVLFVAAAGNRGLDLELADSYPVKYRAENIIGVASHDDVGSLSLFSNRGRNFVDLAAPGESIFSTTNTGDDHYLKASGTSMAAPHVSGVAALIKAHIPDITLSDLKARILKTVVKDPHYEGAISSVGRLDAYRALTGETDKELELDFFPRPESRLIAGRATTFAVRLSDLTGITDATVTGYFELEAPLSFADDGVYPDRDAGDGVYSATITVPSSRQRHTLWVTAETLDGDLVTSSVTYNILQPASNDFFDHRIDMGSGDYSSSTTNYGAGYEDGEPSHAGRPAGASVWWTWSAVRDGKIIVSTNGSSIDTLLAVYTGNSLTDLVEVGSNDDLDQYNTSSRVSCPVSAGVTYHIVVDSVGAEQGPIGIHLDAVIAPPNDSFADAIAIEGSKLTVRGSTRHATVETGEHLPERYTTSAGSVWWRWIAPADGAARFQVPPGKDVMVFAGEEFENLAVAPERIEDKDYAKVVSVAAGQTYYVSVLQLQPDVKGEEFEMVVELTPASTNDRFSNRLPLYGAEVATSAIFFNTTTEIGEEVGRGESIWWTWTSPTTGSVILSVVSDTGIGLRTEVYSGDSLGTLDLMKSHMAITAPTTITFLAEKDVSYQIAVIGKGSAEYGVNLSLFVTETPDNDIWANARAISMDESTHQGSNFGGTVEDGEPRIDSGQGRTIWWRWRAPSDGVARIESRRAVVGVFSGTAVSSLTAMENRWLGQNRPNNFIFNASEGVVYSIAIDSFGSSSFEQEFTFEFGEKPANDDFSGRRLVSGDSVNLIAELAFADIEPGERVDTHRAASVWWTWEAPRSGLVAISEPDNLNVGWNSEVYVGNTLETIKPVENALGKNWSGHVSMFRAQGGETYTIALVGARHEQTIERQMRFVDPPANDSFVDRKPLSATALTVSTSTNNASREAGEPEHRNRDSGASLWWTWNAPADGSLSVDASIQPRAGLVAVYTGDSLSSLQEVRSEYPYRNSAVVRVTGGEAYHIAVECERDYHGPVDFKLQFFGVPPNDDFASASILSGSSIELESSTFGGTREASEPLDGSSSQNRATRWWQWTAPSDGTTTVNLENQSIGEVNFNVFTGDRLTNLVPVRDSFAKSDLRRIKFRAMEGTEYFIQVAANGGSGGDFHLKLDHRESPENDDFANRMSIVGSDVTVLADSTYATMESFEEGLMIGSGRGSLWWSWEAPASGAFIVTGTPRKTLIEVYTGAGENSLHSEGRVIGESGQVVLDVEEGNTYLVRGGLWPEDKFAMRFELRDRPANDDFRNRFLLTDLPGGASGTTKGATAEQGEIQHGYVDASNTVWWRWIAPANGNAFVRARGLDDYEPRIFIYKGTSLSTLVSMRPSYRPFLDYVFPAVEGQEYQIAVESDSRRTGEFTLHVDIDAPPSNDLVENAVAITANSLPVYGANNGATGDGGEPGLSEDGNLASVWYKWEPSTSQRYMIEVQSEEFSPKFSVYRILEDVGGYDRLLVRDSKYAEQNKINGALDAEAGGKYLIMVDSWDYHMGEMSLTVEPVDVPRNDLHKSRTKIEGNYFSQETSNMGAGDSVHDKAFNFWPWEDESTVWWSWTADRSGEVEITVTAIDVAMTSFVGENELSGLLWPLVERTTAVGESSVMSFFADQGREYVLLLSGRGGLMGRFAIELSAVGPANLSTVDTKFPAVSGDGMEFFLPGVGTLTPTEFQWFHDGRALPGEVGRSLRIPVTQPFHSGEYRLEATNVYGSSVSDPIVVEISGLASSQDAHILNLSTRAFGATGNNTLIPGFVIADAGKRLLIRAVGPRLADFGVADVLPDPHLRLEKIELNGRVIRGSGDDWDESIDASRIEALAEAVGAFPLERDGKDAALLIDLAPGQYTVVVEDVRKRSGVSIVELYDVSNSVSQGSFLNLSNRGYVGVGSDVMIPGFVVGGRGVKNLLIRGVGPGLRSYGVESVLEDPKVVIYRTGSNGSEQILTSDNWGEYGDAADVAAAAEQIGAFPLEEGSTDAAFVVSLPPGAYTVHVLGAGGGEGVALVELYELP